MSLLIWCKDMCQPLESRSGHHTNMTKCVHVTPPSQFRILDRPGGGWIRDVPGWMEGGPEGGSTQGGAWIEDSALGQDPNPDLFSLTWAT